MIIANYYHTHFLDYESGSEGISTLYTVTDVISVVAY